MKKNWKKILSAIFIISIVVGGYIIYNFQFKEYDVADKDVTEITKEAYTLELPDGSVIELSEDGSFVETASAETISSNEDESESSTLEETTSSNDDTSSTISSSTNSKSVSTKSTKDSTDGNSSNGNTGKIDSTKTSNGSANGGSSAKELSKQNGTVTVAAIKQKYEPVMVSLQSQANDRINALVGRAYNEYQSKKANGESVNYAYFYNKYTSAAAELEGRTDKVFYQVIGIVEKELVANGYSKSHVKSMVNDYENAKESRRSALLDKALNL